MRKLNRWGSPRAEKPGLLRHDVPLGLPPDRAKPIPFPLAQDPPRDPLRATTGDHPAQASKVEDVDPDAEDHLVVVDL